MFSLYIACTTATMEDSGLGGLQRGIKPLSFRPRTSTGFLMLFEKETSTGTITPIRNERGCTLRCSKRAFERDRMYSRSSEELTAF
jgi:hypothetical protein